MSKKNNEKDVSKETSEMPPISDNSSTSGTASDLQDAFASITDTMPDISKHVVDLQQEENAAIEAAKTAPIPPQDIKTEVKRRGRPPKDPNAPPKVSKVGNKSTIIDPAISLAEQAQKQRIAAAGAATHFVEVSGLMLAGEQAKMQDAEKYTIMHSFDAYFLAKGISDFPPGVALAIGLGGYYARVFITPPAQTKVNLGVAWAKNKWSKMFKKGKRKNNATHTDSGNDNVGENHVSEEIGARL